MSEESEKDKMLRYLKFAKNERYERIKELQAQVNGLEAAEMIIEKHMKD